MAIYRGFINSYRSQQRCENMTQMRMNRRSRAYGPSTSEEISFKATLLRAPARADWPDRNTYVREIQPRLAAVWPSTASSGMAGMQRVGILRHSSIAVTMSSYVKAVNVDVVAAMAKVEEQFSVPRVFPTVHETGPILLILGRRGRNRTCNPRIRNPMLYPFELRARKRLSS